MSVLSSKGAIVMGTTCKNAVLPVACGSGGMGEWRPGRRGCCLRFLGPELEEAVEAEVCCRSRV